MAVPLQPNHAKGLSFLYTGPALPGGWGSIRLKVKHGSQWWTFDCMNKGNNSFYISGREWGLFAEPWIRKSATFTLYSKEEGEDFHKIKVR